MEKKNVVITHVSSHYDYGGDEDRWNRFRPSIALCTSGDIRIDVLHLRYLVGQQKIAMLLAQDIAEKCPTIDIQLVQSPFAEDNSNGYNFEEIYQSCYEYLAGFPFDYEKNDYYIHIPPGRGPVNAIAHILILTYLNIKCKLIHHKVNSGNTLERAEQKFIAFEVKFSDWLTAVRTMELEGISGFDFLKFNIQTKNSAYNDMIKKIEKIALNSSAPILLSGEPGVGKTRLAKQIYELKKKAGVLTGKYVEINCSMLKGEGLMSMLFGHSKGAYTGAVGAREGLLKSAHNGLVFLDEITEMPILEQAVLLKALEEKRFLPFGSDVEEVSNFQIICGTNKNIDEEVAKGNFRYDLLTRIGMWRCHLPPLRERREDIPGNVQYELRHYNISTAKSVQFLPDAFTCYINFALSEQVLWKGNMRSLSASIERMATFAIADSITVNIVKEEIERLKYYWHLEKSDIDTIERFPLLRKIKGDKIERIDLFDKFHLENTLQVCKKAINRTEAGKILFAESRLQKKKADDTTRLNSYLKIFEITWADIKNA